MNFNLIDYINSIEINNDKNFYNMDKMKLNKFNIINNKENMLKNFWTIAHADLVYEITECGVKKNLMGIDIGTYSLENKCGNESDLCLYNNKIFDIEEYYKYLIYESSS